MTGTWTVCRERRPAATHRLYCFPHAGGSAAEYVRWSTILPSTIELHAVQLPGRGGRFRERPFDHIDPLIDQLATELRPEPPYLVFGHSLGALVGFEFARAMADRAALGAQHVVVSGHPAPGVARRTPPVRLLADEELLDAIDRRHGSIPPEVRANRELLELVLPSLRADHAIAETYEPLGPDPIDAPLTVCCGRDDGITTDELDRWSRWTTSSCRFVLFDGGHFYVREQAGRLMTLIASLSRGPSTAESSIDGQPALRKNTAASPGGGLKEPATK
jgi:medium-chain acyl-[acyl-carrier-protein] hydrolase